MYDGLKGQITLRNEKNSINLKILCEKEAVLSGFFHMASKLPLLTSEVVWRALRPNYIKKGKKYYQFEEIVWKKKHFYPVFVFGLKMASIDHRGCMTALKAKLH